jgi:large subunit ribosomal protein L21
MRMYAVIATGGKQYRVSAGDVIRVEKLDAEAGSTITFDQVLMLGEGEEARIGQPFLDGETVSGTVRAHGRGDKIQIIKFKRRKHHRKQMGHRQSYTEVEITAVAGAGPDTGAAKRATVTAKKAPAKKAAAKKVSKKTAKKAPARKAAAKTTKKTTKKAAGKKTKKATRKG